MVHKIKVFKANVDHNALLLTAMRQGGLSVHSLPCVALFFRGKAIASLESAHSVEDMRAFLSAQRHQWVNPDYHPRPSRPSLSPKEPVVARRPQVFAALRRNVNRAWKWRPQF